MSPRPDRAAEAAEKVQRLRRLLLTQGARALVLTRSANFAWLSAGARSFVNVATDLGVAWALVTPERVCVLTTNIEADRLREEELAGLDWDVLPYPWWEPAAAGGRLREVVGADGVLLADAPFPDARDVSAEVARLRAQLSPVEQARAAEVGSDAAAALETCCRTLRSGETEMAIAGRLAAECHARGLEPVVLLVAADSRAYQRRHPLPTARSVQRYVLAALGARRGGLILSATRLVHFGPPGADLQRRWRAAAAVDAEMIAASQPGATAGQVLAAAQAAYARAGFADEWRQHHQGGLAGYASREWRAVPDGTEVIAAGQLLAWNPSVAGAKSEDTVLVQDGGAPPRVLTRTGEWPEEEFQTAAGPAVHRPAILVRDA